MMCSCGPTVVSTQPQYETMYGPNGQQQVVFYDNGARQVMEYAMFMSLMNNGGYNNVIHHYHEPNYHSSAYRESDYTNYRRSAPVNASPADGTQTRQQGSYGSGSVKTLPTATSTNDGWKKTTTNSGIVVKPAPTGDAWKKTSTNQPPVAKTASAWTKTTSSSSSSSSKSSGGYGGGKRK